MFSLLSLGENGLEASFWAVECSVLYLELSLRICSLHSPDAGLVVVAGGALHIRGLYLRCEQALGFPQNHPINTTSPCTVDVCYKLLVLRVCYALGTVRNNLNTSFH